MSECMCVPRWRLRTFLPPRRPPCSSPHPAPTPRPDLSSGFCGVWCIFPSMVRGFCVLLKIWGHKDILLYFHVKALQSSLSRLDPKYLPEVNSFLWCTAGAQFCPLCGYRLSQYWKHLPFACDCAGPPCISLSCGHECISAVPSPFKMLIVFSTLCDTKLSSSPRHCHLHAR